MLSNNNNPPKITAAGVIFAMVVIAILSLIAVPRFREASRVEVSKEARVLAVFGQNVSATAEVGVNVSCGTCGEGL